MTHWIGTSGFQYPEWKGKFYPADLSAARMLPCYAAHFPTTEINYSFRRIPSSSTLEKWASATPAPFRFSLKAPQKITHFARLRDCADPANFFLTTVRALGPKLGCVLFQLPPALKADPSLLRDFLSSLHDPPRLAFEFRHPSWFTDETYRILHHARAALCVAESEDLCTPSEATASGPKFAATMKSLLAEA